MNSPASSSWDVVDQASLDSFPPSAPPAWGSPRTVASAAMGGADDALGATPEPRLRRHTRFLRGMITMGVALGGLLMLAMRVRRRTH